MKYYYVTYSWKLGSSPSGVLFKEAYVRGDVFNWVKAKQKGSARIRLINALEISEAQYLKNKPSK